ncbi:hypothetical protein CAEBREN_18579 [Caenorhabditis brenneri]|uniref:G-protein coupled receptors family 1 profile domain-containing protein n=1 Tax=Caenorhabditis brenneri TaxID=135651 RepID=G0NEH6_CAEBE|nr:hypothetical protein CAEBREN_18579 [Caenorhabditis brenneri]
MKKSPSLSLFYFRFTIDGVLSVMNILINLRLIFSSISIPPIIQFFISLSSVTILIIRSVLVALIAIDRIFAVFCPILYHRSRTKLNNVVIICVILVCVPVADSIALWLFCRFELTATCPGFGCFINQCYVQYSMRFDVANKLALIDAFIIVVFDIIPATILVNNTWLLEAYGPLLGHTKITGYAVEGLIVYREFRRNRIVPKGKSCDVK